MRNAIVAIGTVMLFALSSSAMAASGATLFKQKCSVCHGAQGQGTPGMAPKLAGTDFIKGPAEPIQETIVNGRAGADKRYKKLPLAMPKLGVKAKDAAEIVKYLKTL